MGQIQNAVSGAVSSIVGAHVAGELKTQRELTSVTKDLHTYADELNKYSDNHIKTKEENINRYADTFLTKAGKERKVIDPEKEKAYNEWADRAYKSLDEQEKMLGGWQKNLLNRVNALKKKGVESIDFDIARRTANTAQDNLFKRGGNQ